MGHSRKSHVGESQRPNLTFAALYRPTVTPQRAAEVPSRKGAELGRIKTRFLVPEGRLPCMGTPEAHLLLHPAE